MGHPLDNAYVKLEHGRRRFTELTAACDEIVVAEKQGMIVERISRTLPDGQVAEGLEVHRARVPIPAHVSLLVGEVVNAFRAALEYLVRQLALLDSGAADRTQFPIVDTPQAFAKQRNDGLKGLTDDHVAAIEKLQPFAGCQWAVTLRRLSNWDKHNDLVVAMHNHGLGGVVHMGPADENGMAQWTAEVRIQPFVCIRDDKGGRVSLTDVAAMSSGIEAALDQFRPDFPSS